VAGGQIEVDVEHLLAVLKYSESSRHCLLFGQMPFSPSHLKRHDKNSKYYYGLQEFMPCYPCEFYNYNLREFRAWFRRMDLECELL
jgi:hypothetical protein